jgi:hypothetical protein
VKESDMGGACRMHRRKDELKSTEFGRKIPLRIFRHR